eukprot:CAMPEP_0172470620 /NCGR_PEP_ID=MMETSP1065-20121228/66815_1 /TAXON_ID=265537 /ORGANISM="Amphiprora paludosa, Strain CCMP125" /LENGTH=994 /DNA_ID=CAMNT_0013228617 /DNA_START=225 /DNA_END=3206 /DNA_ORIENTATION=+
MNPFRRGGSKARRGDGERGPSSSRNDDADDSDEDVVQAIDALVDSDPEGTDIFDDSDNDEDEQNASSINSRQSSHPSESPASFKDVVRNLGQPLLNTVPKLVMPSSEGDDSGEDDVLASDDSSSSDGRGGTTASEKDDDGSASGSAEDYSDDEEEGEDGYKPGGYHRVAVSETYNQRYVVMKKLGWGHFSTVWMVKDKQAVAAGKTSHFFALKVQKSAEHYTEAAMDEVELLDCVSAERKKVEAMVLSGSKGGELKRDLEHSRYVATLHDSFFHSGPNGRHMCMVFSMLGVNLLSVIKAHNYRGIPVPVVKNMVKGVCRGLDFLHRKCRIIHTDLKPENVLLQFPYQIDRDEELQLGLAGLTLDESAAPTNTNAALQKSITELESALADPDISAEEKKRIRKKLKKKRQKDRKRAGDEDGDSSDDDNSDSKAQGADYNFFSDIMGVSPDKQDGSRRRRSGHSRFVTRNFGPQQREVDAQTMHMLREDLDVQEASRRDAELEFSEAMVHGGMTEISFVVRAFVSEEELADAISNAFGGVRWSVENNYRKWILSLTLGSQESLAADGLSSSAQSIYVQVSQRCRAPLESDRQAFSDLISIVNDNLSEANNDADMVEMASSGAQRPTKPPPCFLFSLKVPVKSTFVALSFIESRLPGVVFMTYKRDEGRPQLDSVVFGQKAEAICNHPLAMRIRPDPTDESACAAASCIFGFDLRLVRDFKARPSTKNGSPSFQLSLDENEAVLNWWFARNALKDRLKSFTGVDPTADMVDLSIAPERKPRKSLADGGGFREGGKKPPGSDTSTAPSSRDTSASSAARNNAQQQPNLKDEEMLLNCRTVIVDLGNACWTHRHFSEDIQTRQYRAPEVLVGSKYDTSADIWSLGCMTFELLTGDLLFDPRAGEDYDRDEDHLAMFQELLGKMPKRLALDGKYSHNFFDKRGNLKHIKQLKFWPVQEVLIEKYNFTRPDAQAVADFMTPLLDFDPKTRATALDALQSEW